MKITVQQILCLQGASYVSRLVTYRFTDEGGDEKIMDTISLMGIRPRGNEIVIGVYRYLYIDAVLQLDLHTAARGVEENAVDIPQISDRLASVLTQCGENSELQEKPSIALEVIAKAASDAAMRTWQVREADITVHASMRSEYYDLQSTVDDVSVTIHSYATNDFEVKSSAIPESIATVAARLGQMEVDDFDDSPDAQVRRSIIEKVEEEARNKDAANAAAAAASGSDDADQSANDTPHGTDIVKKEKLSPLYGICPVPMQTSAVISLRGEANRATRSAMLRTVALLEQDRNSQVDGVSALYIANRLEGDIFSAVLVLSTSADDYELLRLVRAVNSLHKDIVNVHILGTRSYGASALETKTLSDKLASQRTVDIVLADPTADELIPWMQIEPDAALDGDPISYSLAFSADAQCVGLYSDQWLMGDDY